MIPQSDGDYYAARAVDERRRSESCTNQQAAQVHGELAARYEALLAELQGSHPNLEIVADGGSRGAAAASSTR